MQSKNPVKMISKGSCDIDDWSNGCSNSALPSQQKNIFKKYIKTVNLNCKVIQMNAGFLIIRDFKKH